MSDPSHDDLQTRIEEAVKNPRNLGEMKDADAIGTVGSSDCGDMLRMWLKFKEEGGRKVIDRATFQTFGCQTAIAVASVATEMLAGKTIAEAQSMSGEDLVMSRPALSFRGVSLTGFNLGRGLAKRSPDQVRAIYADLAIKLRDGVLKAPIDATYPIEDIKEALAHAQKGGRNGKVLVLPNGPV